MVEIRDSFVLSLLGFDSHDMVLIFEKEDDMFITKMAWNIGTADVSRDRIIQSIDDALLIDDAMNESKGPYLQKADRLFSV